MYTIQEAAELLDKSEATVRRWMKQLGMKVVVVETDGRRVYIADDDMNTLVDHNYQRVTKSDDKTKNVEHDVDRLCSVKDVALYLDVSPNSVRNWIRQANIELKTGFSGRDIACITYGDVVRLADLHRCAIVANPSSLTLEEEIKELKEMIKKLAADVEEIKHDLRLLLKGRFIQGDI